MCVRSVVVHGCVYVHVGRCLCEGVCVQGEVVYVRECV